MDRRTRRRRHRGSAVRPRRQTPGCAASLRPRRAQSRPSGPRSATRRRRRAPAETSHVLQTEVLAMPGSAQRSSSSVRTWRRTGRSPRAPIPIAEASNAPCRPGPHRKSGQPRATRPWPDPVAARIRLSPLFGPSPCPWSRGRSETQIRQAIARITQRAKSDESRGIWERTGRGPWSRPFPPPAEERNSDRGLAMTLGPASPALA